AGESDAGDTPRRNRNGAVGVSRVAADPGGRARLAHCTATRSRIDVARRRDPRARTSRARAALDRTVRGARVSSRRSPARHLSRRSRASTAVDARPPRDGAVLTYAATCARVQTSESPKGEALRSKKMAR